MNISAIRIRIVISLFISTIMILASLPVSATVEDVGSGTGAASTGAAVSSAASGYSTGPWSTPASPSMPTYLPSPCAGDTGALAVSIGISGPQSEPDKAYTTQGKPLEFMVTVKNNGQTETQAALSIQPQGCPFDWFDWTASTLTIPGGSSRSIALVLEPDIDAVAGEYGFAVEASGQCRSTGTGGARFRVQAFDYASETTVSGTGQFQMNKNLRSSNSGIKSNKDVLFSGSVDALIKNEYLVDAARGRNANFQERDAVDNYNALSAGDSLTGTESFKSSAVFGGVGAKIHESYDVQQMEFKEQDFTLYQTGTLRKTADFKTLNNFTGYLLIDARQLIPGQKSLKEFEEYFGSFEVSRRIVFKNDAKSKSPCSDGDCTGSSGAGGAVTGTVAGAVAGAPASNQSTVGFASPCMSPSCTRFTSRLNSFGK